MRYAQIRRYDVANGPGIRTTLFVTGCPFKCEGCFNAEYQPFSAGKPWDEEAKKTLFSYLSDPKVNGFTLLGGDPLAQDETLTELVKEIKEKFNKNIWAWTGFKYEDLNEKQLELLKYVDVLVDGEFVMELKDLTLKFRGSSNQRIIDLNKTRAKGKLTLWES